MINSITVINHRKESKKLVLADPEESGFAITKIDGLGPVKADISMINITSLDGAVFSSARAGTRNIVISIVFFEKPTIEDSRNEAYRYFPIKKPISLQIETDKRVYCTSGYVESNIPTIFSSEEGCDISILCPSPYFTTLDNKNETEKTIQANKQFEFPFSNESLVNPLIEFSKVTPKITFEFFYKGLVATGFYLSFHVLDPGSYPHVILLENKRTNEYMTFSMLKLPDGGLKIGDDFVICTIQGKKSITLIRGGIAYNVLNVLSRTSKWLNVETGLNYFDINLPTSDVNLFEISFKCELLFEGV